MNSTKNKKPPLAIRDADDFIRHFDVSRETQERFVLYEQLLRKWQKAVNLVAPSTLDEIWTRHIGDSAQIVDIVLESDSATKSGIWLDIGSGGGFPGLVAAIMLADHAAYEFHLVERHGRKCAFLSDVARQVGLSVKVHKCRIEDLSLAPVSIISARALASLDQLLELGSAFVDRSTVSYYFKGRETQVELEHARKKWDLSYRSHNSLTSSNSFILEITSQHKRDSAGSI